VRWGWWWRPVVIYCRFDAGFACRSVLRPAASGITSWLHGAGETIMRIMTAFVFVAGLALVEPGQAQNTTPSVSPKTAPTAPTTAPPGHRQPRQSDVPPPSSLDPLPSGGATDPPRTDLLDVENAKLDRALKSICRGC